MLAGGLPPPTYFPFESISCSTLKPNSFKTTRQSSYVQRAWNWFKGIETDEWKIEKWAQDPSDRTAIQLSTALQYGTLSLSLSLSSLLSFISLTRERKKYRYSTRITSTRTIHLLLRYQSLFSRLLGLPYSDQRGIYRCMG